MKSLKAIVLLLAISSGFTSLAQENKKIYFDAYIGGPQLSPFIINGNFQNAHASGLGPFGARMDFFLTNRSSIGIDANYLQVKVTSDSKFYVYENGSKNPTLTNDYTFSKIRVLLRYAYHFVQKEKLDVYCHAGLGASLWSPNEVQIEENEYDIYGNIVRSRNFSIQSVIPIGLRTGIGLRYLIVKNVGFNIDFAVGGALLTAGLTVKLK